MNSVQSLALRIAKCYSDALKCMRAVSSSEIHALNTSIQFDMYQSILASELATCESFEWPQHPQCILTIIKHNNYFYFRSFRINVTRRAACSSFVLAAARVRGAYVIRISNKINWLSTSVRERGQTDWARLLHAEIRFKFWPLIGLLGLLVQCVVWKVWLLRWPWRFCA